MAAVTANPKTTPKNVPTTEPFFFDGSCGASTCCVSCVVTSSLTVTLSVEPAIAVAEACALDAPVVVVVGVGVVVAGVHDPAPIPGFFVGKLPPFAATVCMHADAGNIHGQHGSSCGSSHNQRLCQAKITVKLAQIQCFSRQL